MRALHRLDKHLAFFQASTHLQDAVREQGRWWARHREKRLLVLLQLLLTSTTTSYCYYYYYYYCYYYYYDYYYYYYYSDDLYLGSLSEPYYIEHQSIYRPTYLSMHLTTNIFLYMYVYIYMYTYICI